MESKEQMNYEMYQQLVDDYHLNEFGGILLLRILLDKILNQENYDKEANDKFIRSYINNMKKESH